MSVHEIHHSAGCSKPSQGGMGCWAGHSRALLLSKGHTLSGLIQEHRGSQCITLCLLQYAVIKPQGLWVIISALLRRTTDEHSSYLQCF